MKNREFCISVSVGRSRLPGAPRDPPGCRRTPGTPGVPGPPGSEGVKISYRVAFEKNFIIYRICPLGWIWWIFLISSENSKKNPVLAVLKKSIFSIFRLEQFFFLLPRKKWIPQCRRIFQAVREKLTHKPDSVHPVKMLRSPNVSTFVEIRHAQTADRKNYDSQ